MHIFQAQRTHLLAKLMIFDNIEFDGFCLGVVLGPCSIVHRKLHNIVINSKIVKRKKEADLSSAFCIFRVDGKSTMD